MCAPTITTKKPKMENATSVVAHAQRGRTHNLTCCLVCGVSRQFVVIRACAARSLTLCHAHTHTHTDGAYVVLFTFWVYLIVDSLSNSIFITHSGVAVAQSRIRTASGRLWALPQLCGICEQLLCVCVFV